MLTGSFGVLLLSPDSLTVGASGAVFGLMGAALAVFRARGINPFDTALGGAVMINLLITFTLHGISVCGHVGALIRRLIAGWIQTAFGPRVLMEPHAPLQADERRVGKEWYRTASIRWAGNQ